MNLLLVGVLILVIGVIGFWLPFQLWRALLYRVWRRVGWLPLTLGYAASVIGWSISSVVVARDGRWQGISVTFIEANPLFETALAVFLGGAPFALFVLGYIGVPVSAVLARKGRLNFFLA